MGPPWVVQESNLPRWGSNPARHQMGYLPWLCVPAGWPLCQTREVLQSSRVRRAELSPRIGAGGLVRLCGAVSVVVGEQFIAQVFCRLDCFA
jgi:hypothetical protein